MYFCLGFLSDLAAHSRYEQVLAPEAWDIEASAQQDQSWAVGSDKVQSLDLPS